MKNKTRTNIKKTITSTVATTMLLSSGIPAFAQTAEASSSNPSLSTLPSLPTLDAGTSEFINGEYIVTFKEGTTVEQMKQTIEKYGGTTIDGEYKTNIVALKLTNQQYEQMKDESVVEIIEKNQKVELTSFGPLAQYSHEKTNVPSAWKNGVTGEGIKIAVLDTGISDHTDLDIAGGVSTVNYTNSYKDDNGHGTHVAGIIASKNNGVGTTGVASDAEIYSVKVLNYAGKGDLMDIIEGMDWAINKGVDIINVSLGTKVDSATLKAKVDEAEAKGIIVVAASGNSGDYNMTYPAKYDNVVAVGATDQNNNLASFSSRGSQLDVVAPGAGVVSTYLGDMYANGNGTSQAAPYVTGLLALLSQQYPDKSANELVQMLYDNALDLGSKGKDDLYGYGLVQYPSLDEKVEEPKVEEVQEPVEEVEEPKQEVTEEPKEEPVVEKQPEEQVVEEQPVQEEQPVEKEEPKEEVKEEPKQKVETPTAELPEGVTFDAKTKVLNWESFANANRYRVAVDEKQADGSYKQHRYPAVVTSTEYDLSRARLDKDEEYKVSIIPCVGFSYKEDQAIELFVSSKGDILVVSGQEDSIKEQPKEEVNVPTKDPMKSTEDVELPEGISFDENNNKIVWENFAGANRYRVKMETIDSNENLKEYRFPRTVIKAEFTLSYLRDKDNYKLTIIPRIGFKYDEDQAKELFVSNKGKKVIVAGLGDSLDEMVKYAEEKANVNTPAEEKVVNTSSELPYNISYDERKDTISWDKIDGTNRYRLEMERKNSRGQYVRYSYKRTIIGSQFKTARILPNGHEYKVKIVPRIGYKYDYDKAFEVYVSTKDGKVTINTVD